MPESLKSLPPPEMECRMDFFLQALKAMIEHYKQFNASLGGSEATQHHQELDEFVRALDEERSIANLDRALIACRQALADQANLGRAELQRRSAEARQVGQLLSRHLCVLTQNHRDVFRELEECSEALYDLGKVDDFESVKRCLVEQAVTLKDTVDRQRRRDEFTTQQMSAQVSLLTAASSRVKRRLKNDPLTGAGTYETFIRTLSQRVQEASMQGRFALLLWDVDRLQTINERHGPLVGDSILRNQVGQCQRMIRGGDYLGRYVDDQFAIILDDVDESLAVRRGAEIVRMLSHLPNSFSDGQEQHDVQVSVCMGVAEYAAGDTAEGLLAKAEKALQQAKSKGHGQWCAFQDSSSS